jgi:hypothetical protein
LGKRVLKSIGAAYPVGKKHKPATCYIALGSEE